jgi:coenzyme F420-reducing hydrogenase delta subunit/ferredoxin
MLLALALARPVVSQGPADLASVPGPLALDWFYLFLHPLMYVSSAGVVWGLVATITLLLLLLPFLPRHAVAAPIALVDPDNCNGCRRCFDDCPYAAIVMVPHPDGKKGQELAQVIPGSCASCGICAGSCPSATPFRNVATLLTGIDMPQLSVDALRRALKTKLDTLTGDRKIAVFGCDHGASLAALEGPEVASFSLICSGMLPPSFVEYALREGATGVLVTGCRENGCVFRLGSRWTEQRLLGLREPYLRATVAREKLRIAWADAGEEAELLAALADFRRTLETSTAPPAQPGRNERSIDKDAANAQI